MNNSNDKKDTILSLSDEEIILIEKLRSLNVNDRNLVNAILNATLDNLIESNLNDDVL